MRPMHRTVTGPAASVLTLRSIGAHGGTLDGVLHHVGVRVGREVDEQRAFPRPPIAARNTCNDVHVGSLPSMTTMSASLPGEDADVREALPGGGIDGRHLDRHDGFDALLDGAADDVVHVAGLGDVLCQHVVRGKNRATGVETFLRHGPHDSGMLRCVDPSRMSM